MRSVMDGGGAGMVWYGMVWYGWAVCDDGRFRMNQVHLDCFSSPLFDFFNITEVFVLFLSDENV